MAKLIKLTRLSPSGDSNDENVIYLVVDTILFFEEKFAEGKSLGTFIFFNSTVGQDYAPVIVKEPASHVYALINCTT